MITIISGSNRKNNKTLIFAKYYQKVLKQKTNEDIQLFDISTMPIDAFHSEMYNGKDQHKDIEALQNTFIIGGDKFIILSPEYNGSIPGMLKAFIDACSVRDYESNFTGKKIALVGIAAGRAGNQRGMDHLTSVLNYIGGNVMPNQLPISLIGGLLNEKMELIDEGTQKAIEKQIDQFLQF